MKKYRLIEHTADTGLVAYGRNLAEAFAHAACGLFSIMVDLRGVREVDSRPVEITEATQEDLLFEWLNSLIYVFEVESLLLKRFEVKVLTKHSLSAVCYGERYDPLRHHLKTGVKSATYYRLSIDWKKNQVRVIFDV